MRHWDWHIYPMAAVDMEKPPEYGVFPFLTKVIMRHFAVPNNGKSSSALTEAASLSMYANKCLASLFYNVNYFFDTAIHNSG